MCIETLYEKSNVGSKVNLQEGKQLGVLWGHIKIKWKDGIIILTAGGISKLLIKRLTIKDMKTQVSKGLLILSWYFEKIWLYGTIFKCHFIALKKATEKAP